MHPRTSSKQSVPWLLFKRIASTSLAPAMLIIGTSVILPESISTGRVRSIWEQLYNRNSQRNEPVFSNRKIIESSDARVQKLRSREYKLVML